MAMRSLGYMPNEVELEVIIQRLDMDGEANTHTWYYSLDFIIFSRTSTEALLSMCPQNWTVLGSKTSYNKWQLFLFPAGDGQVDFEEFVTLLGPKLTAAGLPDKFNGTDFDSVFWKVLIIQLLISCLLETRQMPLLQTPKCRNI